MNRTGILVVALIVLLVGCGPGWEGYEGDYSEPVTVEKIPWEGDQTLFIQDGKLELEVPIAGLATYDYLGAPAVSLSEVIEFAGVTDQPEAFRYDFTAADGYNLFIKRYEDLELLPCWDEMQGGFLYLDSRSEDLTTGWTEHPWGSALSAYLVKYMNGGTITLMPNP